MFNGKYTHVNEILERVRRDYAFEEVFIDEAKEWIWDCIGYFGRNEILVDSVQDVTISSWRGLLPTDLYKLKGCREKNTKISLLPTTDRYFTSNLTTDTTLGEAIIQGQSINIESTGVGDNIVDSFTDPTIFVEMVPTYKIDSSQKYNYYIQENYIYTGLENTTLEVSYLAFPMWEDYTPKIPDTPKVVRMVSLFIANKIAFKLMLQDKLSERKWQYIHDELDFAVGSARNEMVLPDEDEMENIRRMGMRLLPKPNRWEGGFKDLNLGESLKRM